MTLPLLLHNIFNDLLATDYIADMLDGPYAFGYRTQRIADYVKYMLSNADNNELSIHLYYRGHRESVSRSIRRIFEPQELSILTKEWASELRVLERKRYEMYMEQLLLVLCSHDVCSEDLYQLIADRLKPLTLGH